MFLNCRGITGDSDTIEACHPLPRRKDGTSAVILRFVNRKHKTTQTKQGRKLKGSNVNINNHLTRQNAQIAKKARYLRGSFSKYMGQ